MKFVIEEEKRGDTVTSYIATCQMPDGVMELRVYPEFKHHLDFILAACAEKAARNMLPKELINMREPSNILTQWEITRDRGRYSSMMFVTDKAIVAFANDLLDYHP